MKRPRWGWLPPAAYMILALSGVGALVVPPPSVVDTNLLARVLFHGIVILAASGVAWGILHRTTVGDRIQRLSLLALTGPLLFYGIAILYAAGSRAYFAAGLAFYAVAKCLERFFALDTLRKVTRLSGGKDA